MNCLELRGFFYILPAQLQVAFVALQFGHSIYGDSDLVAFQLWLRKRKKSLYVLSKITLFLEHLRTSDSAHF